MTVALHHVADGPAGAPVLVLAGSLGSTTAMWEPQLPALVPRSRVVRTDLRGHGGSPAPDGPYAVAAAVAMAAGTPDAGYAGCCAAPAAWDHRGRLPAVTAPTLVIAGADDPATPVEPHARTLAAGIPGAHLEVVPGAHLATIESAAAVNELLVAHLTG